MCSAVWQALMQVPTSEVQVGARSPFNVGSQACPAGMTGQIPVFVFGSTGQDCTTVYVCKHTGAFFDRNVLT